jgi:hypothetical protein
MPDLEPTERRDAQAAPDGPAPNGPGARNAANPSGSGRDAKPKPKGLLPVPQEVIDVVDAYIKSFAGEWEFSPQDRERIIHGLALQWHYGGETVVQRRTERGYEVLASGDEVWEFLRTASNEEKQGVQIDTLPPWDGLQLPRGYAEFS